MDGYTIKIVDEALSACCVLCSEAALWRKGPRVCQAPGGEPVCRDCARAQAPSALALADLASVAEKVGKQCRHLLTPPMEAMLELARAAENYAAVPPRVHVKAGALGN